MTGEAAASGLRFFLDRGLGSRIVPDALRQAAWVLETMDERYGKTESHKVKDTQWIEEASLAGDILLFKEPLGGQRLHGFTDFQQSDPDGIEYQAVGQVTSLQMGTDGIDGGLNVCQSLRSR